MVLSDIVQQTILKLSETKSLREIAVETGVSKSTVGLFLKKAKISEPETVQEIIEPIVDMSIDQKDASSFINSVTSTSAPLPSSATAGKILPSPKLDAFLDNLLKPSDDGVPTMPHVPRPGKAKKVVEPKPKKMPIVRVAPVDDGASKGELIAKITLNVSSFEPLLKDILVPNKDSFLAALQKKTAADLETIYKNIETTRSVKNMTNQMAHFFFMGSSFVEMGTQKFLNMQTQGFTQALQAQQDEIKMILQEICLERQDTLKKVQRPEARLALLVTTTLLGVNIQNQIKNQVKSQSMPMAKPQQPKPQPQQPQQPQQPTIPKPQNAPEAKKVSIVMPDEANKYSDL
jgi:hypothetical protein